MDNSESEFSILHLMPVLHKIIGMTDIHKKYGITKSQIMIFIMLRCRKSMTMSEVAQYISSSKEQATRTVAALCDAGLTERYEEADNRTHVFIRTTKAGEEYLEKLILNLREDISERLKSSLSEDDIHNLRNAVNTTIEILCKVK